MKVDPPPVGWGGRVVLNKVFYREAPSKRPIPDPFRYHFSEKRYPFHTLLFRNGREVLKVYYGKKVTAPKALQTRGEGVSETPFPAFLHSTFSVKKYKGKCSR